MLTTAIGETLIDRFFGLFDQGASYYIAFVDVREWPNEFHDMYEIHLCNYTQVDRAHVLLPFYEFRLRSVMEIENYIGLDSLCVGELWFQCIPLLCNFKWFLLSPTCEIVYA